MDRKFLNAILKNEKELVKELLHLSDIKYKNIDGDTALTIAVSNKSSDIESLINHGFDVNHINNAGNSSLILAMRKGNLEFGGILITHGANANHACSSGYTPALATSIDGQISCLQLLIDQGINVNHRSNNGNTALINAAMKGHTEYVKLLFKNGAYVNHKNNKGNTALINMFNTRLDADKVFSMMKLLMENGADPLIEDDNGNDSWVHAKFRGYSFATDLFKAYQEKEWLADVIDEQDDEMSAGL